MHHELSEECYPMWVLSTSDFLSLPEMLPHEELRVQGKLIDYAALVDKQEVRGRRNASGLCNVRRRHPAAAAAPGAERSPPWWRGRPRG